MHYRHTKIICLKSIGTKVATNGYIRSTARSLEATDYLGQRFPTWGACTPGGTIPCPKGYI